MYDYMRIIFFKFQSSTSDLNPLMNNQHYLGTERKVGEAGNPRLMEPHHRADRHVQLHRPQPRDVRLPRQGLYCL